MVSMTPLANYLGGKLINAFDAAQNVFSDAAKTTPCANDGPVYHWGSSGGISSLDCSQVTLSRRPLWKADYLGLGYPALLLDGTDDWMQIASNGVADYTADFATFVVGRILGFSLRTFAGRTVSGGTQFGYHTSSTETAAQVTTSGGTLGTGAVFSESPADGVWGFGFNSGRSIGIAGLSLQSRVGAGTANAPNSNWYLGTYNGGSLLGQFACRAFVLTKGLTLPEIDAIRCWLAVNYGYSEAISGASGSRPLSRLLNTGA